MAVTPLSSETEQPRAIASKTLATVNTWEVVEVPSWARLVTIINTHPTAILRVATWTADGTAAPGAVQNIPVAAGAALTMATSAGQAEPTVEERQIALHSTQASHIAAFLIEAALG